MLITKEEVTMAKLKLPFYGKVLVEAIQEFDEMDVYPIYDNSKFFQVLVPNCDTPFTGCILGSAGEFYGFNLFAGENGLEMFTKVSKSGSTPDLSIARKFDLYTFEMLTKEHLSYENRRWLKAAGVKLSQNKYYPDFTVHKPGKMVDIPNDKDVNILLYAIKGMIEAIKTDVFAPTNIMHYDKIFTIKTSGKPVSPEIEVFNVPVGQQKSTPVKKQPPLDLSAYDGQSFEFANLPRVDTSWIVHNTPIQAAIDDDLASIILIIDIKKGPRQTDIMLGEQQNDPTKVWEKLKLILKGESQTSADVDKMELPREFIFFEPQLYEIAKRVFKPLKITCTLMGTDSKFYEMTTDLTEFLNEQFAKGPQQAFEDMKRELSEDEYESIAGKYQGDMDFLNDDYKLWNDLDRELRKLIYNRFDNDKSFKSTRALKEYFGGFEFYEGISSYDQLFAKFRLLPIVESYCNWFILNYRATYRSKTVLQKWLKDPEINIALKEVISEFIRGFNGIYRLDVKNKKKGEVTFVDFFNEDEKYEIIDFSLACSLKPNRYLPARIYTLGEYDFYSPMGRLMLKSDVEEIISLYKEAKVEFSPLIFDYHPVLYGWMWHMI